MSLNNIRVVLVRTFHSGNIGSAARAMKTMGLDDLTLVDPIDFQSEDGKKEALKMAMSADDVVNNATVVNNLYDAVKDCTVVIASTARSRGYDLPVLSPEKSAELLYQTASVKKEKVALLFGPERMGLSNGDLEYAKYRVTIPTNPNYSSLNLAAAVQTLSYEVYKQHMAECENVSLELIRDLPNTETLDRFYIHLEESLSESGFIIKNHPGEVMQKLRSLFSRAELDSQELNILRGVLASFQRSTKK